MRPCQICATRERPPTTSANAGQTRRRTGSCQANRAHSATGRGRELEEEPDPDRQAVDRDEVEPLHEGKADDAVEREPPELASRSDLQPRRREYCESEREADEHRPLTRSSVQRNVPMSLPSSASLETAPLTANSVAATIVIAYPSRGRRWTASVPGGESELGHRARLPVRHQAVG